MLRKISITSAYIVFLVLSFFGFLQLHAFFLGGVSLVSDARPSREQPIRESVLISTLPPLAEATSSDRESMPEFEGDEFSASDDLPSDFEQSSDGSPPVSKSVYEDILGDGWQMASWNATTTIESGLLHTITYGSWGAFSLRALGEIPNELRSILIDLRIDVSTTPIFLVAYDGNGTRIGAVPIADYALGEGGLVAVPLADLGHMQTRPLRRIAIQSEKAAQFYISRITLETEEIPSFSVVPREALKEPPPVEEDEEILAPEAGFFVSNEIYREGIGDGWRINAWNASVDPANSDNTYQGVRSLRFDTHTTWGSLVFEADAAPQIVKYQTLSFSISGDSADVASVYIVVFDTNGNQSGAINVREYIAQSELSDMAWYRVDMPLEDFGCHVKSCLTFAFQTDSADRTLYVDEVILSEMYKTSLPTRYEDTVPEVTTPNLVVINTSPYIIEDGLGAGWVEASWGVDVFQDDTVTFGDHDSFAVTPTEAWGAFALQSKTGLDTGDYKYLEMYLNGGDTGGQPLLIVVYDNLGDVLGSLPMTDGNEGAPIPSRLWEYYAFPLSELNALGVDIHQIAIQSSESADTYYVYGMRLTHVNQEE